MKLASYYLSEIAGVQIFPIVSLVLFFAFFIAMVWFVIKSDNESIKILKQMPLDSTDISHSEN